MCNKRKLELHGMSGTSLYYVWADMIKRCHNKSHKDYKWYGYKGITVCDSWKKSFIAFYNDMGIRPFLKAQIDRKDNDKGYTKSNCHWVTSAQNCQNKSNNKLTIVKVKEIRDLYRSGGISQDKIALIYGVSQHTISWVVRKIIWK